MEDADQDMCCSFTMQPMVDPVMISTGFSYERNAITDWLQHKNTCPRSNRILPNKLLIPNQQLRMLIAKKYPEVALQYELRQKLVRDAAIIAATSKADNDDLTVITFQPAEWQQEDYKDVAVAPLHCKSDIKISDLTQHIARILDLPDSKISLFFRENIDSKAISFLCYEKNMKLNECMPVEDEMPLTFIIHPEVFDSNAQIRVQIGKTSFTLAINLQTSIGILKHMIGWQHCISPFQQHLFFPKHVELKNDQILTACKIRNNCTLHLVLDTHHIPHDGE